MAAPEITLDNKELLLWILKTALNRKKNHPVSTSEIFRLPELFPFMVPENGIQLIRESSAFSINREGMNQEYIYISD